MKVEYSEKVKAVRINASYEDFVEGLEEDTKYPETVRAWQEAYFRMLEWKNTWGMVYDMDINGRVNQPPFVTVVVNKKHAERTCEYMESLGYKVAAYPITVELVEPEYEDAIDEYYIQ